MPEDQQRRGPDTCPDGAPPKQDLQATPVHSVRDEIHADIAATAAADTVETPYDGFIDREILPAFESKTMQDVAALLDEVQVVLRQGYPTTEQIHAWLARIETLTADVRLLFVSLHSKSEEQCDAAGSFAMSEAAHFCHKFLGYGLKLQLSVLRNSIAKANDAEKERWRALALEELGGDAVHSGSEALMHLRSKYKMTKSTIQEFFADAQAGKKSSPLKEYRRRAERDFTDIAADLGIEEDTITLSIESNLEEDDLVPQCGIVTDITSELVKNALKVMADHGGRLVAVTVTVRKDRSIMLTVRDDGPVRGDADPDEIFSGKTTTEKYHGSGVGLSLMKKTIEEKFRGQLRAMNNDEDEDGARGMTLICTLPSTWDK